MTKSPSDSVLRQDDRGVAPLIGFIILFGFFIIALSSYQAYIIPQQNSEVEFQHFEEVRNDMIEVRSSISTAGQADVSQFPTVKLGTYYPTRVVTVNPPPPSGTLRTSQPYNISITNQTGADPKTVSTRFLKYQNGYNEMRIGSLWYEHSVLYLDERSMGGEIVIYQDQNIVSGNEEARVTALQNEFRVSSSGRVTVNLYPTENASITTSDLTGDITVKVPSRLNGSTYWDEAIDTTESDNLSYEGTESYPGESDIYWVVLTVEADALNFNTVGINSAPERQESARQGVGTGSSESTTGEGDSTPAPAQPISEGVSIVSGSTPSGESPFLDFKLKAEDGAYADIVSFEVTKPGNQNNVDPINSLQRTGNEEEVELDPTVTTGNNQAGDWNGKYNIGTDGAESLDTTAIFEDGTEIDVLMGELNKGNVKSTYDLVNSESNSDITVIFYFSDGSKLEVYLRVSKLNT
ncbi:hypothetical protein [Halobellus salinus]|nr:hypothetical protein [Halobellus salinus]